MYGDKYYTDLTPSSNKDIRLYSYKDKRCNNVHPRRKGISFSEPLPCNRLRKTINNREIMSALSRNTTTSHTVKQSYRENDDLIDYLKQIHKTDSFYSCSSPLLRRDSDIIANSDCSPYTLYSNQTMPNPDFYQTCFMTPEFNNLTHEPVENPFPSPSYLNYTLEYPLNHSIENTSLSPPAFDFQDDSSTLQPPKRMFFEGIQCFSESHHRKNNNNNNHNNTRGLSIDTSSALSSETDSDFTFYPCCYREQHDSLGLEHPDYYNCNSPTICELPSQLEDPDSPFPPYRQGVLENSLEDVSRQFYLEDDALSDDVFFDDYSHLRGGEDAERSINNRIQRSWCSYRNSPCDANLNARMETMAIVDTPRMRTSNSNNNVAKNIIYVNDSPPRCSVALERRKERVHSLTLIIKSNEREEGTFKSQIEEQSKDNKLPPSKSPDRKKVSESEIEEFDLSEYNLNLANAFDSLRRNSMQTKSRKLWKERRTRMRRSTLFNVKTTVTFPEERIIVTGNEKYPSISGTLPCDYKVNLKNVDGVNGGGGGGKIQQDAVKPLRGILKNKHTVYPTMPDAIESVKQNGTGEYHDYNDVSGYHNNVSSDNVNNFTDTPITSHNDDNQLSPLDNQSKSRRIIDIDNHYTGYSLDSRAARSAPCRKAIRRSARPLVTTPPLGRKLDRSDSFSSHSPVLVSVGVQVNLIH